MISVEEAITILQSKSSVQTRIIQKSIEDAVGYISAYPLHSPIDVPHFYRSGMDGYAVKSSDTIGATYETSVRLNVIGEVLAGDDFLIEYHPMTAIRIMTGGRIPDGYDSVIKQEDTDEGHSVVALYCHVGQFENYSLVGEDIKKESLVIDQYTRLTPQHIAVCASIGLTEIDVLAPLRIGIISTGNEITHPGEALGSSSIYSSTNYLIASSILSNQLDIAFMTISRDDPNEFCDIVINNFDNFDVLITTGAVSVGKKDFITEAMSILGATTLFHGINLKPGTPVLASQLKDKLILSLSGNPFAAFVNFHLLFWPIVSKALCNPTFLLKKSTAVLKGSMRQSNLRRYIRAFEKDGDVHLISSKHFSSIFSSLTQCNCLIEQSENMPLLNGDTVTIYYFQ